MNTQGTENLLEPNFFLFFSMLILECFSDASLFPSFKLSFPGLKMKLNSFQEARLYLEKYSKSPLLRTKNFQTAC